MRLETLWLIALCSLSYYLYNDRPTTGGDPSSRQRQWTRRLNWVDVWRESFPVQSTQTKVGEKSGRLPNFLLVGAQKAGTTATYSYLRKQDGVCGTFTDPNGDKQKETHFFDKTREFRLGMEYYRSKFSHCDSSKLILDATPNYMLYPERVREIYEQQGTADTVKVMFILREPVSREISWWEHLVRCVKEGTGQSFTKQILRQSHNRTRILSFEEHMQANILPQIDSHNNIGLYAEILERWFQLFHRNQIYIASYDDFKESPKEFLYKIHRFLGTLHIKDTLHAPRANSRHVETDRIPCLTQGRLADIFYPHNLELYKLLDAHPGRPDLEPRQFRKFEFKCAR